MTARLIQKRETYKDIRNLITDLYDEAFEMQEQADLTEILTGYSKVKQEYYDNLKSNAIRGVLRGARNFIDTLIKLQTSTDSFGLNQTMLKFRDQLTSISSSLESTPDESWLASAAQSTENIGKTRND